MATSVEKSAIAGLDADVREAVKAWDASGAYGSDEIDFVEVKELQDSAEVVSRVLKMMSTTCLIDIGDFDIPNRGGLIGGVEVFVKRFVWKLLRFYTYRMFSQQREFNTQIVAVLNEMWARIQALEAEGKSRGSTPSA
ncbi:MAG: hypothetical protein HQ559_11475 [Lentisphaerae bacterium]|nr:hypothetical protein [Lentisphaerota bacterium]